MYEGYIPGDRAVMAAIMSSKNDNSRYIYSYQYLAQFEDKLKVEYDHDKEQVTTYLVEGFTPKEAILKILELQQELISEINSTYLYRSSFNKIPVVKLIARVEEIDHEIKRIVEGIRNDD